MLQTFYAIQSSQIFADKVTSGAYLLLALSDFRCTLVIREALIVDSYGESLMVSSLLKFI